MRLVVLDGAAMKACRVLRARLSRLGFRVLPYGAALADELLIDMAERGALVATSDKTLYRRLAARGLHAVYVPMDKAARMNSRCLATFILKRLLRPEQKLPPMTH